MSSSDYAQIADVTSSHGSSGRSKIYEEISELQSSGERNIFGVRLRPSFHRAHELPTQSQVDPDMPKPSPSVTSFKPAPKSSAKTQNASETTTKPEEVLYAKPKKPAVKLKSPAQTVHVSGNVTASITTDPTTAKKKFNKPPPSFAPPPPPNSSAKRGDRSAKDANSSIKRDDRSAKDANSSEYAQPFSDKHAKKGNDTKGKGIILESDYAQIVEEDLNPKTGQGTIELKEESDDEHTYYFADSISRSMPENTEDITSVNEEEKKSVVQPNDHTTHISCSNSESEVAKEVSASTAGGYEEIDMSQVVRRKRGSHVTLSFADDTPAPNDSTDGTAVPPTNALSASDRRANFRSKVDDEVVEETYENQDVFVETTKEDNDLKQKGYEHGEYGMALDSVIGTMVKSLNDTDIITEVSGDNGEAFTSLKDYWERNSVDGFDLESHRVSCRDSVEKLQSLLLP